MTCNELNNWVAQFQEGSDAPENWQKMSVHFQGCPSCQKQHHDVFETLSLLSEMKDVPVPDPGAHYWNNVPAQVRTRIAQEGSRRKRLWIWGGMGVTVTALLLFVIGVKVPGILPWTTPQPKTQIAQSSSDSVDVDTREIASFYSKLLQVSKDNTEEFELAEGFGEETFAALDLQGPGDPLPYEEMEEIFEELESFQL